MSRIGTACLVAAIVMTLSVLLKVIPLLQAFSGVIFRVCDASHSPSASAELLVFVSLNFRIENTEYC